MPQLSLAYVGGWMTRCLSRSWWKHQIIEFGISAPCTMKAASTTTAVTVICTDRVASCAAQLVAYLLNDENDQTVCFSAAPDPTLHSPSRRHDVCFSADSERNHPKFR